MASAGVPAALPAPLPAALRALAGSSKHPLLNPASNAAKHNRRVNERITLRAVRRPMLGKYIYAYNHIFTNQVVYSLTNVLEPKTVMPQLLFHGKKSVPASVRRDLWLPYFRAHFPTTKHGMTAYRQLRELSLIRQLAPPLSIVKETSGGKEVDRKKKRAAILMNQKASSAADLAFVLSLQGEVKPSTSKPLEVLPKAKVKHPKRQVRRQVRNMKERKKVYDYLEDQYNESLNKYNESVVKYNRKRALDAKFSPAFRAMIDQQIEASMEVKEESEQDDKDSEQEGKASDTEVKVFWADIADALVGAGDKWPSVVHSTLDPTEKVGKSRNVHMMAINDRVDGFDQTVEPAVEKAPPKSVTSSVVDRLMFWKKS